MPESNATSSSANQLGTQSPTTIHKEDLVTLDIGGRIFRIHKESLCAFPDSMLGKMFSEWHHVEPNPDGHYFFDRDPELVAPIINFYRSHKLFVVPGINVEGVKEEARLAMMQRCIF
ncbi:BTB/POZ domain-containing protein kctd9 [Quaeritorhiza haematococci]|nr:BTB/POZ domain-containing protein kctd9 [Quaeritorhiza haematococci]